jgi:hypothetical protein
MLSTAIRIDYSPPRWQVNLMVARTVCTNVSGLPAMLWAEIEIRALRSS